MDNDEENVDESKDCKVILEEHIAARRVLAPFLKTLRKQKTIRADIFNEEFKEFYLQTNPGDVLAKLGSFYQDSMQVTTLLNETAEVLKMATKAKGVFVYLVDPGLEEITLSANYIQNDERNSVKYKIGIGTTVAAFVAHTKEFIMMDDVLGDIRFPEGIPGTGMSVRSVLCVPVVTTLEGDCIGVVELYKDLEQDAFQRIDLQLTVSMVGWLGVAVQQNKEHLLHLKRIQVHDYLTSITQLYFAGAISFDKIISDFIVFGKTAVGGEKGSFVTFDTHVPRGTEDVLIGEAYEESREIENTVLRRKTKPRYEFEGPGMAGVVARSGCVVNLKDAYKHAQFDKEADGKLYRTRTLISVPVMDKLGVMGVLQIVNKLTGPCFDKCDETLLKTFADYALLSCHFARLTDAIRIEKAKLSVNMDLLEFHISPCPDDLYALKTMPILSKEQMPDGFFSFTWYIGGFEDEAAKYALHVFMGSGLLDESYFHFDKMCKFILMVQKSYRKLPYHNFTHAFNVFHCGFNIIIRNKAAFTDIEIVSFLIACLCHDCDHFGYTNGFLELTSSPLCDLYAESMLENHHFQSSEVLSTFSNEENTEIIQEIRSLILASDLFSFFENKMKAVDAINSELFDWNDSAQRSTYKKIMINMCDVSGELKPFEVGKKISEALFKEFYSQGDKERSLGLTPLPTMDREQILAMPDCQIYFISIVCVPCAEIMVAVFPNLEDMQQLCLPEERSEELGRRRKLAVKLFRAAINKVQTSQANIYRE